VGLLGAPFFLSGGIPLLQVTGSLLFLTHSILDGCDGEPGPASSSSSRRAEARPRTFWGRQHLVHVAVFACMAIG